MKTLSFEHNKPIVGSTLAATNFRYSLITSRGSGFYVIQDRTSDFASILGAYNLVCSLNDNQLVILTDLKAVTNENPNGIRFERKGVPYNA